MKQAVGAPGHLSPEMQTFFRSTSRKYQLGAHHLRLLAAACESHDRMTQAREQVAAEGMTTTNRHGETKAHPAVTIEANSRVIFARLLRELALADDVADTDSRPPRLRGRYAGRP